MARGKLEFLTGFGVDFTESFFWLTWVTVVRGIVVLSLLRRQWRLVGTGPDDERGCHTFLCVACDVLRLAGGPALPTLVPHHPALQGHVSRRKRGDVTEAAARASDSSADDRTRSANWKFDTV